MPKLLLFIFLLLNIPIAFSHPPIGIVIDSKGNLYYTDLEQVWKLSKGVKSIVVPKVHTHQLCLDKNDNLYGEDLQYNGEALNTYNHFLWRLNSNGKLDTVIGKRQAYLQIDYSLARDPDGNEYYIKDDDSTHLFKKTLDGKESVLTKGDFNIKEISWLHPQQDGSILFLHDNNVYRVTIDGRIIKLAQNIGNKNPTYKFWSNGVILQAAWKDKTGNVYVAIFSDQTIRKISPEGQISDFYKSSDNWTPTSGVFDSSNQLWVLETNKQNEVRVVNAAIVSPSKTLQTKSFLPVVLGIGGILLLLVLGFYLRNNTRF